MDTEELHRTKRHLPHWTLKGSTYFVTFRAKQAELTIGEQRLVLEQIKEGNHRYYDLIAAVVMPDHVHIVLTPKAEYSLSNIMKGIKGVSAHKINVKRKTSGSIWQDESFDRIIRDEDELNEKIAYMFHNPLKKGLTEDPWSYHGWYYAER